MFCEKARAALCQQQSPQAEVLLTDGTIAVVAANTSQLVAVNFGPIDMVLMDANNVSVSVLTSHLMLNVKIRLVVITTTALMYCLSALCL